MCQLCVCLSVTVCLFSPQPGVSTQPIKTKPISRPRHSQGLLCNHLHQSLTDSFIKSLILFENICTAPARPNSWLWWFHLWNRLCWEIVRDSKSQRASKSYYWFKSYGDFDERGDFAYWWSCIGKGLRLQPAQQAWFIGITLIYIYININESKTLMMR